MLSRLVLCLKACSKLDVLFLVKQKWYFTEGKTM